MMEFDFKEKIEEQEALAARRRQKLRKIYYIIGFVSAFIILFAGTIVRSGNSFESWFGKVPFLGRLFGGNDRQLTGEADDRINILLLGMGGKGHDGPYLTDSIILASLKPSTKEVALISIPRDLAVPTGNGYTEKINSINSNAITHGEDGGAAAAQTVGELFEIPVPYYITVDFEGFVNIVNQLGGITVTVDNTLDDYEYPIIGQEDNPNQAARYEHLHVAKGVQTMDGDLALKYARSRHGIGSEGSDFARSKRQQKVLVAFKDALLQKENLLKPAMLADIIGQLQQHISTNLSVADGLRLWKLFKDVPKENIQNQSFDDGPGNFLADMTGADGAYLLVPKTGNFSAMKDFVQKIFGDLAPAAGSGSGTGNSGSGDSAAALLADEKASVQIKNGTNVSGLASSVADKLRASNFSITSVGNASQRDLKATVIYDLTYGAKETELEVLEAKINASATTTLPDWLTQEIKADAQNNPKQVTPDFLLILGADSSQNY